MAWLQIFRHFLNNLKCDTTGTVLKSIFVSLEFIFAILLFAIKRNCKIFPLCNICDTFSLILFNMNSLYYKPYRCKEDVLSQDGAMLSIPLADMLGAFILGRCVTAKMNPVVF